MNPIPIALSCLIITACSHSATKATPQESNSAKQETTIEKTWPTFNGDSAFEHVANQVKFGPRVPATPAHARCRDYIAATFRRFGADTVFIQRGSAKAHTGESLPIENIMARFNTGAPRRILIAAHYDTRPWADEDPDSTLRTRPIDGANDGASGVGVALELARNIGMQSPAIGVDFLITDLEDYGKPGEPTDTNGESSWCLGSQFWAANIPYTPTQRPAYGVLLDMVGGRGARFYRELFSEQYASWLNARLWNAAKAEGITRFIDQRHGAIDDDHLPINDAGIPCIDIIECNHPDTGAFPPYWHTTADNLSNIDSATLGDVGKAVMRLIFTERAE